MKKTYFVSGSILVVVVLLLILIWNRQREGDARTTSEIHIGALLPLTGDLAYLGQEERNALKLAVEDLNASRQGKVVSLTIEDSKGSSKDGVAAYRKLRTKHVDAIITALTAVSESTQPLCAADNLLQIALSVDPELAQRSGCTLRPYYGLEQEMDILANFISTRGAKRLAALYINVPECERSVEGVLKPLLASRGIEFVGKETYGFADTSVKNQLAKLQAQNPDYIMTIDFGFMYPRIFRDAAELGLRERLLGGLGMMTAPPMAPELTSGVVFAAASFVVKPTQEYIAFSNRFQQRFNAKPTFDAVYTYDALMMLVDGIRHGKTTKAAFLDTVHAGISGPIAIDTKGVGKVAISIGQFDAQGGIQTVAQ